MADDTVEAANKLRAAADWFTDCKTLTLDRLPVGLIAALRAGADALDTPRQSSRAEPPAQAQEVEEAVYHGYVAARDLATKHPADYHAFQTVLKGLHAARRFVFHSYTLPQQSEQNWAAAAVRAEKEKP